MISINSSSLRGLLRSRLMRLCGNKLSKINQPPSMKHFHTHTGKKHMSNALHGDSVKADSCLIVHVCKDCRHPFTTKGNLCRHNRICSHWCRWDISLVSNAPIGTGFGPQNITVITSQESHHWHAFLIRFAETHFPYSLDTETSLGHKMRLFPTIPTV